MTTFGDRVFENGGVPVSGGGMLPILGGGAKAFFVDPANGADGNSGLKQDQALDTVGQGYSLTTDKAGDVVYLLNDGNTTGSSREATIPLVWSNDNTHCVGLCAPVHVSQRSRITPASSAALTEEPVLRVSGHGNIFKNLQIAHWGSTDAIGDDLGVEVTGNRNYFENCHIAGICHANPGDEADANDLLITGEENLFVNCTIGLDTVTRTGANANIEFTGAAARNVFRNCLIQCSADAADPLFVKIDGAGDIDRYVIFENCIFYNAVGSTATTMTAAMSVHASAGGLVILKDCMLVGATDWEAADSTNIYLMCHTQVDTTGIANMGIGVTVDVTA